MHLSASRFFAAALLLVPALALAQREPQPGTVSASGIKLVKEKPTEMRMTIQLKEKASTLKDALAKLKTRTDAAQLQLEQLGVMKDGVEVSDPTASSEMTEQERRMRQMMAMRARAGGGRKPKEPPKSVTVSSTVTAKWALGKRTGVELLEFCHTTQEKVAAADLAGLNEKKTLTPEEEELAEEAAEMMNDYGNSGENPAEPTFFFVGKISQETRNAAMKEAFAKAKGSAEDLAAAAGAKLGKLSSLSEAAIPGGGGFDYESVYGYGSRAQMVRQMISRNAGSDEEEAISPSPEAVSMQVTVHATFGLE